MKIDFSKVNSVPINNIAIQISLILGAIIISMIVVGVVLKALRVPNVILNKILGLTAIFVLFGMFKLMY